MLSQDENRFHTCYIAYLKQAQRQFGLNQQTQSTIAQLIKQAEREAARYRCKQ